MNEHQRHAYYQVRYRQCREAEDAAIRSGDHAQASAYRAAAIRWLEMAERADRGDSEDEAEGQP